MPKMVQGHSMGGRTFIFELIKPKNHICKVFLWACNLKNVFANSNSELLLCICVCVCVCVRENSIARGERRVCV